MKFQTRSSDDADIQYFETFEDALKAAQNNKNIWKISFNTEDGSHIRLVRDTDNNRWFYEDIFGRTE